jgi:hypothetical protein
MLFAKSLVHLMRVAEVEIPKPHQKFWRPIVAFALPTHVVLLLLSISFVNEMKGLAVVLLLGRTRHRRLLLFSFPVSAATTKKCTSVNLL